MKFNKIVIYTLAATISNVCGNASKGKEKSFYYPATTGTSFNFTRITDLVIFGDSYSNASTNYSTMKYSGWNQSGGKNWGVQLSEYIHPMSLWNFARDGAVVDTSIVNSRCSMSMVDQYNLFLENMTEGKKFGSWKSDTTLFALWFGINDINFKERAISLSSFAVNELIMRAMFSMVEGMYDQGARNFVFFYVPAYDLSPRYINKNDLFTMNDIPEYNLALKRYAENFSKLHTDVNVFVYDAYSEFLYIMEHKADYGFTVLNTNCPNIYEWEKRGCLEPKNYFWYDDLHPLYRVHEIMAQDLNDLFMENSNSTFTISSPTLDSNKDNNSMNSEKNSSALSRILTKHYTSTTLATLILILFYLRF